MSGVEEVGMLRRTAGRRGLGAPIGRQRRGARSPPRRSGPRCGSDAHSHEPLDLEDAAREAGSAPITFCACSRACSTITPHQYLCARGCGIAARLLRRTDRSDRRHRLRRRLRRSLQLRSHPYRRRRRVAAPLPAHGDEGDCTLSSDKAPRTHPACVGCRRAAQIARPSGRPRWLTPSSLAAPSRRLFLQRSIWRDRASND